MSATDDTNNTLTSLAVLAGKIEAAFNAVDSAGLSPRIEAGRLLLEAREHFSAAGSWTQWCAANVQRSYADIKKCMALARAPDPQVALEAEREARRASMAKSAAKKTRAADGSQLGAAAGNSPAGGAIAEASYTGLPSALHVAGNKKGIPISAFPAHIQAQIADAINPPENPVNPKSDNPVSNSAGDAVPKAVPTFERYKAALSEMAEFDAVGIRRLPQEQRDELRGLLVKIIAEIAEEKRQTELEAEGEEAEPVPFNVSIPGCGPAVCLVCGRGDLKLTSAGNVRAHHAHGTPTGFYCPGGGQPPAESQPSMLVASVVEVAERINGKAKRMAESEAAETEVV